MKKTATSNFKKILSLICSLAIILGVSIQAFTISAAPIDKNGKKFDEVYSYPSLGTQYGAVYDFNDSDDYLVTNQENAMYLAYSTTGYNWNAPTTPTATVENGKLVLSSGVDSGYSTQSWVINKNGVPFELIPNHEYTVTFDFESEGTFAENRVGSFISLSNGVATNDWRFKAEYNNEQYWFGASSSVMPQSEGVNYLYRAPEVDPTISDSVNVYPNSAIFQYESTNHIVHGYAGYASKTYEKTFVAYDVTNGGSNYCAKNYLAFTFSLQSGCKFVIDNIKICDNTSGTVFVTYNNGDGTSETVAHSIGDELTKTVVAPEGYIQQGWVSTDGKTVYKTAPETSIILNPNFVLDTDALSPGKDSITYNFSNASDYVLNNGTEKYWSRNYSLPGRAYPFDGTTVSPNQVAVPVNNALEIKDNSLVLKSGIDDVDFSKYSSSGTESKEFNNSNKRSIASWIINKNGKPIEIIPGMEYKVSVKLKNYKTAAAKSFISISNGVAYDDINEQWFWTDFGASVSVMPGKDGVKYSYLRSDKAVSWNSDPETNIPNTAIYHWAKDLNNIVVAHANTSVSDGTYTRSFQAYDITESGINAKRHNYLALTFSLCQGQSVEIEEITVSYNYSKVSNITYNFNDGTVKSVIEKIGENFSESDIKEGYIFVGWQDGNGNIYNTVPAGGKITVYPKFGNSSIKLDDKLQNKIELDFANPNEYSLVNSNAVANKYLSYYRPGNYTSVANEKTGEAAYDGATLKEIVTNAQKAGQTVQIVEDENVNRKVLKLTSGLPDNVSQSTIQSWILNKNGKPIEIQPGEYYTISVQYREAKKPAINRPKSFISVSNGIAYDDVNEPWWWTDFGATASVMNDENAKYSYITGGASHTKSETEYPNSAVRLYTMNHNALVWADEDSDYTSDYYTTKTNTFLAYDITEGGTKDRANYLALTFAVAAGQEIYIDTITVTKVHKLSFETYGNGTVSNKYAAYGTKLTLPKATPADGEQFVSWTNMEASVSYADVFMMPADDVTLYALYDSAEVTVDPNGNGYEILDSCENMEIDEDGYFSAAGNHNGKLKLAISNSSGSGNYLTAQSRAYKIAFNYLINGDSDGAAVNAFTAKTGKTAYKEADSYALNAVSSDDWQAGKLVFVLKPDYYNANGQYCLANELYLGIDGLDNGAALKVKDIVITVLDEPVLTVDYNLGDNKVEHKTNVQLDTPAKDGFVFGGWYDSLSQEEFTATELTGDTTVYADWITEYVAGDVNYDSEFDVRDLVRFKKIAAGSYDNDQVIIKRGELNADYTSAQNLTLLRKLLLNAAPISEVQKSAKIAGININNYCVAYETGTNVLLNDAVSSLNTALGNPAENSTFKIAISNDADKEEGIFADGVTLIVNSADEATLISYVNQLARTITRYEGKYYLGFNSNTVYGNSNLSKSEYAVTFRDEFDDDSLSDYWLTPTTTNEAAYKATDNSEVVTYKVVNADRVNVNNGSAVLKAIMVDKNGDKTPDLFTTQSINSSFNFTYGYLEARVKIAKNPATSSFWLKAAKTSSVTNMYPEYDIYETNTDASNNDHILNANIHSFGQDNRHYSLDDWNSEYGGGNGNNALSKEYKSDNAWSDDYHVFAVKWDADDISYYVDGYEYFSYSFANSYLAKSGGSNTDTFNQPMSIIFSAGMGGYNYGPLWSVGNLTSADVEIDYVRLYQSEADGGNLNGIISAKNYKEADWKLHPQDYKLIALTFDDAPAYSSVGNNATTSIIDTLNKYYGAGTLFVTGNGLETNGVKLLRYAVDNRFELGNHTYSHKSVGGAAKDWTVEDNKADFKKLQDAIYEKLGINMKWLRPAELAVNTALYTATTELGLPVIGCSIGTGDWNSSTTKQAIKDSVLQNAHDGGIVLMHSWVNNTADVLEEICEELYNNGYRFCTLSELFEFKGISYNDIPCDQMINSTGF